MIFWHLKWPFWGKLPQIWNHLHDPPPLFINLERSKLFREQVCIHDFNCRDFKWKWLISAAVISIQLKWFGVKVSWNHNWLQSVHSWFQLQGFQMKVIDFSCSDININSQYFLHRRGFILKTHKTLLGRSHMAPPCGTLTKARRTDTFGTTPILRTEE